MRKGPGSVYDKCNISMMTSTKPMGTLGLLASLLAATFYHGNPDRNHKLWNMSSTERGTAAGMLLHINEKFTMGKSKSSLLS